MARILLTERQRKADLLGRNLRALQGRRTAEEMAHLIGAKSATTWRERLRKPLSINVEELVRLGEKYKINPAELISRELIGG